MSDQHQTDQKEAEQLFRSHSPSSLRGQQLRVAIGYNLFAVGAFLMSLFFLVDVWVGGLTSYQQWDTVKWVMFAVAMVVTAALTMGQHATYDSGLNSRLFTWAKAAVIAFALFSEISQTMERENSGAQQRGMETEEYKAATGTASLPSIASAATVMAPAYVQEAQREKAAAMVELGRCDRHASKGAARVEKCRTFEQTRADEAQAVIDGYREDRNSAAQALQTTSVAMLDKAKELRTSEDNHKSMIRFISELLGVKAIFGAFLFAVLIIAPFELMFYAMGVLKHRIAIALKMYGLNTSGKSLRDEYEAYGIGSPAPATAPVSALHGVAQAVRQAVQDAPEAIGNEMMKAQGARNALHQQMQAGADKLADTLDKTVSTKPAPATPTPDLADVRESNGFRQSPEQRANAEALAVGGLADKPNKPNKPDKVGATGESLRQRMRKGERIFPGQNGLDSRPAPSTVETTGPNGYTHSPDDTHSNRYTHSGNPLDGRLQKVADDLYPEWVAAVQGREITAAKDPCQKFIWKHSGSVDGKTVISAPETLRIWNDWQVRAANDGALVSNPKYTGQPPHPKYILNPAYK